MDQLTASLQEPSRTSKVLITAQQHPVDSSILTTSTRLEAPGRHGCPLTRCGHSKYRGKNEVSPDYLLCPRTDHSLPPPNALYVFPSLT